MSNADAVTGSGRARDAHDVPDEAAPVGRTTIRIGDTTIETGLHRWAVVGVSFISVVLSAAVACYGTYLKLNAMHLDSLQKTQAANQAQLVQQKSMMLVPIDDMRSYTAQAEHEADSLKPRGEDIKQEVLGEDATVVIHHYHRDGCIHIVTAKASGETDSKWVYGLRDAHKAAKAVAPPSGTPKNVEDVAHPLIGALQYASLPNGAKGRPTMLLTAGRMTVDVDNLASTEEQQCWNPHPGQYSFQNQQLNQCLVQQVRTFYDGCIHSQLFNACSGSWDVNPDGSPRVTWLRCLH